MSLCAPSPLLLKLTKRLSDVTEMRRRGEPTVPFTMGGERRTNPFLRPKQVPFVLFSVLSSVSSAH